MNSRLQLGLGVVAGAALAMAVGAVLKRRRRPERDAESLDVRQHVLARLVPEGKRLVVAVASSATIKLEAVRAAFQM